MVLLKISILSAVAMIPSNYLDLLSTAFTDDWHKSRGGQPTPQWCRPVLVDAQKLWKGLHQKMQDEPWCIHPDGPAACLL